MEATLKKLEAQHLRAALDAPVTPPSEEALQAKSQNLKSLYTRKRELESSLNKKLPAYNASKKTSLLKISLDKSLSTEMREKLQGFKDSIVAALNKKTNNVSSTARWSDEIRTKATSIVSTIDILLVLDTEMKV